MSEGVAVEDQAELDPRVAEARDRLTARIGVEMTNSVIRQLMDGYSWQAWLNEHGHLKGDGGIHVDIGRPADRETGGLIAALWYALLNAAQEAQQARNDRDGT